MIFVVGETRRTKSLAGTIQAVHIALALIGVPVELTNSEEAGLQQRAKPWWTKVIIAHFHHRTHHDFLLLGSEKTTLVMILNSQLVQFSKSFDLEKKRRERGFRAGREKEEEEEETE